jgi:N-acetylglutamate synthase-like GNAT family acetyltransferase
MNKLCIGRTMEITIRKATRQDCEALCEIHVSAIRGLGKSHYSGAELDAWSSGRVPERYEKHIAERHVIVAEHGSKPVGFGTLDLTTGEVLQLYVRPEYGRKGIGRRILRELLDEARRQGLREVHCLSSLNAEAFYASSGFHAGGKCKHRFRDGGEIHCVRMKRMLDQDNAEGGAEPDTVVGAG